jgi:hypothetical protein
MPKYSPVLLNKKPILHIHAPAKYSCSNRDCKNNYYGNVNVIYPDYCKKCGNKKISTYLKIINMLHNNHKLLDYTISNIKKRGLENHVLEWFINHIQFTKSCCNCNICRENKPLILKIGCLKKLNNKMKKNITGTKIINTFVNMKVKN